MLRLCKLGNINVEIIGKRVDYISFPSAGLEKSVGSRSKAARRPLLPCANSCPCGAEQRPAGQGGREQRRQREAKGLGGAAQPGVGAQRDTKLPPPLAHPPGTWEVPPRSVSQRDTSILWLRLPFGLQQTL